MAVDIPSIGVHAKNLQPLGITNGAIDTPDEHTPQIVGYYTRSNAPCRPGPNQVPFALVAHIDGHDLKGAFFNLKNIKPGDVVTIALNNGQSCNYRITELAEIKKTNLVGDTPDNRRIWGPTAAAQIRLVSCGGPYIGPPEYYRDNLVGIGTLVT